MKTRILVVALACLTNIYITSQVHCMQPQLPLIEEVVEQMSIAFQPSNPAYKLLLKIGETKNPHTRDEHGNTIVHYFAQEKVLGVQLIIAWLMYFMCIHSREQNPEKVFPDFVGSSEDAYPMFKDLDPITSEKIKVFLQATNLQDQTPLDVARNQADNDNNIQCLEKLGLMLSFISLDDTITYVDTSTKPGGCHLF